MQNDIWDRHVVATEAAISASHSAQTQQERIISIVVNYSSVGIKLQQVKKFKHAIRQEDEF